MRQLFHLDAPTFVALWDPMDFSFTGRRDLVLTHKTNIVITRKSTAAMDLKE